MERDSGGVSELKRGRERERDEFKGVKEEDSMKQLTRRRKTLERRKETRYQRLLDKDDNEEESLASNHQSS